MIQGDLLCCYLIAKLLVLAIVLVSEVKIAVSPCHLARLRPTSPLKDRHHSQPLGKHPLGAWFCILR